MSGEPVKMTAGVTATEVSAKVETVTMNGHQLRDALDFINPDGEGDLDQLDNDLTFGVVQHQDDQGNVSTGLCCWNDDMDGEVYPLDGDYATHPATSTVPAQNAAQRPDILERLTYHALERDDMTIGDLLQTLSRDGYRNVRQRSHRQLELQLLALLAGQPSFDTAPTDISFRLREYAADPGYSHNDYADVMRTAADECERFYGGMMAWKKTAQKKDADWQAEHMRPVREMTDMLGRLHPYEQPYHGEEFRAKAYERLKRAVEIQQPWPVPDQAAVVWRGDLMKMRDDLTHKQAAFEDYKRLLEDLRTGQRASQDVLAERRRQVEQEGHDAEHDDQHRCEEIAAYAAFFAMPHAARTWPATETGYGDTLAQAIVPEDWPIPPDGDRRRELVKAGALILAEIERLDRGAANLGGNQQ